MGDIKKHIIGLSARPENRKSLGGISPPCTHAELNCQEAVLNKVNNYVLFVICKRFEAFIFSFKKYSGDFIFVHLCKVQIFARMKKISFPPKIDNFIDTMTSQ